MKNRLLAVAGIAIAILTLPTTQLHAEEARGDTERAPDEGGYTQSLGMPPVYKGSAGIEAGWYRPSGDGKPEGLISIGLMRDLGSPIVGAAGLGLQGYGGLRGNDLDGGGRGYFLIPNFRLGLGLDYNIRDDALDFLFALGFPIRRGGIVGHGSSLIFRWIPGRGQTISLGIEMPLWGSNLSRL